MIKTKKKTIISGEKVMSRNMENFLAGPTKSNSNYLTKELFAIAALYGCAIILVFILLATINYAVAILLKEAGSKSVLSGTDIKNAPVAGESITYAVDRVKYEINDKINLSIINKTAESIFLAPCQYFNKFEKKDGEIWKAVILDNCGTVAAENSSTFEKIPKAERQSILAAALGEGVWRGVSDVYIDCEKADISFCKRKRVVYSNVFMIEALKNNLPNALENKPGAL